MWADTWEAPAVETWQRQYELARAIASAFRLRLPVQLDSEPQAVSPAAFEKWLRARSLFVTLEAQKIAQAIARAEAERGLGIQPHWTLAWVQGAVLLRLERYEEAYQVLQAAVRIAPPHCWVEPTYANACLLTGRQDELRELVLRAESDRQHFPAPASTLGLLHAVAGEVAAALGWLETALAERDPALVFQPRASAGVIVMPEVEWPVYEHPRWQAIVAAMGLG
jgi:tetratricopeptide (TPR) repeat protein